MKVSGADAKIVKKAFKEIEAAIKDRKKELKKADKLHDKAGVEFFFFFLMILIWFCVVWWCFFFSFSSSSIIIILILFINFKFRNLLINMLKNEANILKRQKPLTKLVTKPKRKSCLTKARKNKRKWKKQKKKLQKRFLKR